MCFIKKASDKAIASISFVTQTIFIELEDNNASLGKHRFKTCELKCMRDS